MIQCVPGWDHEEPSKLSVHADPNHVCSSFQIPMMDYEVAELTWENGQLALHGFRQPRVAGDTLECVVNQATRAPSKHSEPTLAPWFQRETSIPASANTMDALVPCSYPTPSPTPKPENHPHPHPHPHAHPPNTCLSVPGSSGSLFVGSSTHVDSCSAPFPTFNPSRCLLTEERTEPPKRRRTRDGRDRAAREVCSRNQSACGSDSLGSTRVTLDTCDVNLDVGFTSNTSLGSPENTSSAKPNSSYTKPITVDDFDSDSHGKPRSGGEDVKKGQARRSFISNKRSRAAAIHNQSERKRRDRINQRIKTLQKLVPNSSKTDKASMLDEVIEYLKQLQAQVQMMSRISTPQIMMPMTMQQLQMSMMAHLGMGMSMGMGMMDMNGIARTVPGGLTPMFHPGFPPLTGASWDGSGDRLLASGAMLPDPFCAFLACQTQSMTMDAYKRMVALYQQLHQPANNNSKDPRN